MKENQNEIFIVYTDNFNETYFINNADLEQLEKVLEDEKIDFFKVEEQTYQKSEVSGVRVNGYKGYIFTKLDDL